MSLRLAAALVVAGCATGDAPHLDDVTPAQARRGDPVRLRGTGFCVPDCAGSPVGTVVFGLEIPQVRAVVISWTEAMIEVVVPQSIDTGPSEIIVTVNDRSSNALAFEVVP